MRIAFPASFRASNVGKNLTRTCGRPSRITAPSRSENPLRVTKSPKSSPLRKRVRIESWTSVKRTLAAPLAVRKIVFSAIFDRVTRRSFPAREPTTACAP